MVMWTNTHCFDFFLHVILYNYIVSIRAKLQTSSASAFILINFLKVTTESFLEDTTNQLWHYVTDFVHFFSHVVLFNVSFSTKSQLCIMKTFFKLIL